MTGLPVHLIRSDEVAQYLAGSVATAEATIHATTPSGARSFVSQGPVLSWFEKSLFGRGIYGSSHHERAYGDVPLRLAIPNRKPLEVSFFDENRRHGILRRVAAATGVDLLELTRHPSRAERMEAGRQALLAAGYDSITLKTFPHRHRYLVGIDPAQVRVVLDDSARAHLPRGTGAQAVVPTRDRPSGSVLAGPDALTAAAAELARSPEPVAWQVRQLDDYVVAPLLADRAQQPEDLFLFDRHVRSRTHAMGRTRTSDYLDLFARRGATVVPYGAPGDFLHGKVAVGTNDAGERVALVRTNTDEHRAWRQGNLGVLLKGDAAEAAERVIRATATGNRDQIAAAAADAARGTGLLVHDAHHGVDEVRPAVDALIDRAARERGPLRIIEKELTHAPTARRIAAAHQAGAQVEVTLGRIDRQCARILRDAGVPLRMQVGWVETIQEAHLIGQLHRTGVPVEVREVSVPAPLRLMLRASGVPFSERPFAHLNVFAGADETIVGSFHHMDNMAELRQSQELGVKLTGERARLARAEAQHLLDADR